MPAIHTLKVFGQTFLNRIKCILLNIFNIVLAAAKVKKWHNAEVEE